MDPEDPPTLADRIRRILRLQGWVHVRDRLSEGDFEATARHLGTIDLRTDIVVDPERRSREKAARRYDPDRPSVYQESGLEFHSDRPTADVLAWYCVTPRLPTHIVVVSVVFALRCGRMSAPAVA